MPVFRRETVALALGLLLGCPRLAAAADCWGRWQLQLAAPLPDQESWLTPGSWCRGKTLPRTFTVDISRSETGRLHTAGDPFSPTELAVGAGQCEFQFSEDTGVLPKNHELSIEVNAAGTVLKGKARCSEKKPKPEDPERMRGGITIELAVTGSRLPLPEVLAAGLESTASDVVGACQRRDPDALWKMMTPRFRAEIDQWASQVRRAVPAADLRKLYRHRGRVGTFTGLAYLRYAVRTEGWTGNPCAEAAGWELGQAIAKPDGWLMAVRRADGYAFSLRFTRDGRGWHLDQMSQVMPVHKPRSGRFNSRSR